MGMARGAGGREWQGMMGGGGGCCTAVGKTAFGWPTAGSCTTRIFILIYSPTCHETCLEK